MPVPLVRNLDHHIVFLRKLAAVERRDLACGKVSRAQCDGAAVRHGIAGVDGKVEDDLLELAEIGSHRPQVATVVDLELDVGAGHPVDEHAQVADDVGHVQNRRPHCLLARKRQELPHQHGRPVGVALDFHQVGKTGICWSGGKEQIVGGQKDGRQDVVEVVRDAAGQRADRVHLLRLRHLCFERLLLGDVDRIDDRRFLRRLIALVDDGVHIEAEMPRLVGRMQRIDRRDVALPVLGGVQRIAQPRPLGGMDDRFEKRPVLHVVLRHDTGEEFQERRVGAQNPAVAVDRGDRHRRIVEEAGKAHRGD